MQAVSAQSLATGKSLELAQEECTKAGETGARIIAQSDPEYPSRLKERCAMIFKRRIQFALGAAVVVVAVAVAGCSRSAQSYLNRGNAYLKDGKVDAAVLEFRNAVKKDPSAIGFLSDYFALAKSVKAVGYNGTGCTVANVVANTYPGVSDFYEVTKGPANGAVEAFIYWVQSSATAKKIIQSNWIPLGKVAPAVKG